MSYKNNIAKEQRRQILEALEREPDYKANGLELIAWLDDVGMNISVDKLHTELQWLEEQGLITLESARSIKIAKLTQRGLDLAQHRMLSDGVARARPQ